jgi:hypothetical protein
MNRSHSTPTTERKQSLSQQQQQEISASIESQDTIIHQIADELDLPRSAFAKACLFLANFAESDDRGVRSILCLYPDVGVRYIAGFLAVGLHEKKSTNKSIATPAASSSVMTRSRSALQTPLAKAVSVPQASTKTVSAEAAATVPSPTKTKLSKKNKSSVTSLASSTPSTAHSSDKRLTRHSSRQASMSVSS